MQKITCKFACFLSSGLDVDLGKCDGNTDDNADDDERPCIVISISQLCYEGDIKTIYLGVLDNEL